MKNLRQLCAAFALTFVLTLPAWAGDMSTMIATPLPPSTAQRDLTTDKAGDISTIAASTGSAAEIALNLLQSVLSLF